MKIGTSVYPYLWNYSLQESMKNVKNIGITNIEILASPPHLLLDELTERKINEINAFIDQKGLFVETLNLPGLDINISSIFPHMRKNTVDQYKNLIRLAKKLKTPYVILHPGKLHPLLPPDFEWVWQQTKSSFVELIEFAEKHHVTLLIENMPSLFLDTAEKLNWVLKELKSEYFAAIYDVANGFMVEDPSKGIILLQEEIEVIHLNDTVKTKWSHDTVGMGDIDFTQIYKTLQSINYKGNCILELTPEYDDKSIIDSLEHLNKSGWEFNL